MYLCKMGLEIIRHFLILVRTIAKGGNTAKAQSNVMPLSKIGMSDHVLAFYPNTSFKLASEKVCLVCDASVSGKQAASGLYITYSKTGPYEPFSATGGNKCV